MSGKLAIPIGSQGSTLLAYCGRPRKTKAQS